jgi:hypothetical protein
MMRGPVHPLQQPLLAPFLNMMHTHPWHIRLLADSGFESKHVLLPSCMHIVLSIECVVKALSARGILALSSHGGGCLFIHSNSHLGRLPVVVAASTFARS